MATLKKTAPVATSKNAASAPAKKAAVAKTAAAAPAKKTFPARKKVAGGAAPARAPKPTWDAPSDFKPAFYEFDFRTDAHGLIDSSSLKGSRVRGKWDNADAPRYDLATFDQATLTGFGMRLSAAVFAPNPLKRIPGDAAYKVIVRAGAKKADNTLMARIVGVQIKLDGKKARWFEDKSDLTYRKIRKVARTLPSAFIAAQLPPMKRRASKTDEE